MVQSKKCYFTFQFRGDKRILQERFPQISGGWILHIGGVRPLLGRLPQRLFPLLLVPRLGVRHDLHLRRKLARLEEGIPAKNCGQYSNTHLKLKHCLKENSSFSNYDFLLRIMKVNRYWLCLIVVVIIELPNLSPIVPVAKFCEKKSFDQNAN